MKDILSVKPAQSIVSSCLYSMNGDDIPSDLLTVVAQEIIAEGFIFAGSFREKAAEICGRNNHGLVSCNHVLVLPFTQSTCIYKGSGPYPYPRPRVHGSHEVLHAVSSGVVQLSDMQRKRRPRANNVPSDIIAWAITLREVNDLGKEKDKKKEEFDGLCGLCPWL